MGKENHLLEFRVENFKRFKKLAVRDIGQFNLILGDNNAGKTSLLEALLFNPDLTTFSDHLLAVLRHKNIGGDYKEGHFSFFMNRDEVLESADMYGYPCWKFELQTLNPLQTDSDFVLYLNGTGDLCNDPYEPDSNKKATLLAVTKKERVNAYLLPLIPLSVSYGIMDLSDIYSRYYVRDRPAKRRLLQALSTFIPDIEEIEVDTAITDYPVLVIARKNQRSSIPLVSYGDGTIKLFRILMYLLCFRGNRLMIDEIDAGVHHSHTKDFWRIILQVASENEVQLFMTTHDKECLYYFNEVLQEENMKQYQERARAIMLVENFKTKDIDAITSKFFELEHAIQFGNEVR